MRRFMSKLVKSLRSTNKARATKGGPRRAFLQVEGLENRELLSSSPLPFLDPIQAKYQSLARAGTFLGNATSAEMPTKYGGGIMQSFQNGDIYYSAQTGAHDIYGAIRSEFNQTDAERDAYGADVQQILGLPVADETQAPGVAGYARETQFQGGALYYSAATGAHAVYGAIGAKYNAMGGPTQFGLPISGEAHAFGLLGNVRVTRFQNGGDIYWSQATGAHFVHGAIGAEYDHTGYRHDAFGNVVRTVLGAPTSDEMDVSGVPGARMNTFQGGAIYYSATAGAHVVYGAIGAKYNAMGGPTQFGLPLSDEVPAFGLQGNVRVQQFQNGIGGAIYWSQATGAHFVHGLIGVEYAATANERDFFGRNVQTLLGAPTSDEMDVPGVPGARMNTFQGGAIYWSPSTGAHVVYGAILAKYNSIGGPASFLGLPITDELGFPGGRVSYFQHGRIVWTPSGGAVVQ